MSPIYQLSPASSTWSYKGRSDCITFTVNKPIKLHEVQHFGSEGGEYTVCTEVKDTTQDSHVVKRSGTYASEKDETNNYYGFDVLFDRPVCFEANKQYKLVSHIKGLNLGTERKVKQLLNPEECDSLSVLQTIRAAMVPR